MKTPSAGTRLRFRLLLAVGAAVVLALSALAAEEARPLRLIAGPLVLHGAINYQWGGHTFCYLVRGKQALYWAATEYGPGEYAHTALIGQQPLGDSRLKAHVTRLEFAGGKPNPGHEPFPRDPRLRVNQPHLIRTPDGRLHVFLGLTQPTDDPHYRPGRLRYYRTRAPGDITTLVDRSELLPRAPFPDYHLRMSVGVSRDGTRLALVILAISRHGSVPFNTPIIFFALRQGADFVFQKPIRYAEPMGLFYPQVAVTEDGVVIVGEVWSNRTPKRSLTRLLHLDWQGKTLHREDLPAEVDGNYWCQDLRPRDAEDWSRLVLFYNKQPATRENNRHEFWEYDVRARRLRLLRSRRVPYPLSNAGRWLPMPEGQSLFINNPSMNRLVVWSGDLLGRGPIRRTPLPGGDVIQRGYQASIYLAAPNVLQGSLRAPGELCVAADCYHRVPPGEKPKACSLLLWRLAWKVERQSGRRGRQD